MKHVILSLAVLALLSGTGSANAADCYADYKAKQDNPLRLHYGVAAVSSCSKNGARKELGPRLKSAGWTLLNIVSVFDDAGLDERKESAGQYFLRF